MPDLLLTVTLIFIKMIIWLPHQDPKGDELGAPAGAYYGLKIRDKRSSHLGFILVGHHYTVR